MQEDDGTWCEGHGGRGVDPLAVVDVDEVDADGGGPDADLALLGFPYLHLLPSHHLGAAELMDPDGLGLGRHGDAVAVAEATGGGERWQELLPPPSGGGGGGGRGGAAASPSPSPSPSCGDGAARRRRHRTSLCLPPLNNFYVVPPNLLLLLLSKGQAKVYRTISPYQFFYNFLQL